MIRLVLLAALVIPVNGRRNHGGSSPYPLRFLLDDESASSDVTPLLPPQKPFGDEACPCSTRKELTRMGSNPSSLKNLDEILGDQVDYDTYGEGCGYHDINANDCNNLDACNTIVPLPAECDKSYCRRSWCYVNPENCTLLMRPSNYLLGRYYSYATCGYMDSFTHTERGRSLQGKTLQVAFPSNSGGWVGAYNPSGSFATDRNWEGPMVDFIQQAARTGEFRLNVTRPPQWLRNESKKFFGNSNFDYCVYATSLGYLDLCVAAFTITDRRASVTGFFETTSDPVYLVTFVDRNSRSFESFIASLLTIFKPFTVPSWMIILFLFFPVLGLLMLFHEYGSSGSVFPSSEEIVVINPVTNEHVIKTREVPILQHVPKSIYMIYLSFFTGSYDPAILSLGGKLNLMAIMSFILLVVAVYTANLAAMLTQEASVTPVSSLEEAIKAGYNFCGARSVILRIMDQFDINPDRVVVDPVDGLPGFNCPTCRARIRVFDFMKQKHSDPSLYCNAGIVANEDLQMLHHDGKHCNKSAVGEALGVKTMGFPLYSGIQEELMSWLYRMKHEGVLDASLRESRPESMCPEDTVNEEQALTVTNLTGIWIITSTFAIAGLIAKLIQKSKKRNVNRPVRLHRYDQWGNETEGRFADDKTDISTFNVSTDSSEQKLIGNYDTSRGGQQQHIKMGNNIFDDEEKTDA